MMSASADFIVIGGGVMGLMLSRHLLQAGASVTLLEAGQCGREASWAGGGIVSPLYPWRYAPAVTALSEQAKQLFPALCEALLDETGIDPEYTRTGLLMVDAPDRDAAVTWAAQQGVTMETVTGSQLSGVEPQCAGRFSDNAAQALWMPEVANVRNPRLLQALQAALLSAPRFRLQEFEPVTDIIQQSDSVTIKTHRQAYRAAQAIVCAGAWSSRLLAATQGVTLPVAPVLGQMLRYRLPAGFLRTIVLHDGRYVIPRRDGHVLVGSTLEQRGFDRTVTTDALANLRTSAETMIPALRDYEPLQQWAGLRPGSPEGIPFMGRIAQDSAVWVCAGHFRNGLVLSPASALLMADLLLGRVPQVNPAPYLPSPSLA